MISNLMEPLVWESIPQASTASVSTVPQIADPDGVVVFGALSGTIQGFGNYL